MKKIFVAGSLNMDLAFSIHEMPEKGETVRGKDFYMNPGGKGANQAITCGKQGADVTLVGAVGNDVFADRILGHLKDNGVCVKHINRLEQMHTGVAGIFVKDGQNRIIIDAGANRKLDGGHIKEVLAEHADAGDIFLTQCEIPNEAVSAGLKQAKKLGMTTFLNPAPADTFDEAWYADVDYLIPNEIEAEQITSIPRDSNKFLPDVIQFFLGKGIHGVVVTLGDKGAVYGDKNGIRRFPSKQVDVVDSTAAGDTFVGVLATEYARGVSLVSAIPVATAASAITVSRFGAQASIPTQDEINRFMEERTKADEKTNHS